MTQLGDLLARRCCHCEATAAHLLTALAASARRDRAELETLARRAFTERVPFESIREIAILAKSLGVVESRCATILELAESYPDDPEPRHGSRLSQAARTPRGSGKEAP